MDTSFGIVEYLSCDIIKSAYLSYDEMPLRIHLSCSSRLVPRNLYIHAVKFIAPRSCSFSPYLCELLRTAKPSSNEQA